MICQGPVEEHWTSQYRKSGESFSSCPKTTSSFSHRHQTTLSTKTDEVSQVYYKAGAKSNLKCKILQIHLLPLRCHLHWAPNSIDKNWWDNKKTPFCSTNRTKLRLFLVLCNVIQHLVTNFGSFCHCTERWALYRSTISQWNINRPQNSGLRNAKWKIH